MKNMRYIYLQGVQGLGYSEFDEYDENGLQINQETPAQRAERVRAELAAQAAADKAVRDAKAAAEVSKLFNPTELIQLQNLYNSYTLATIQPPAYPTFGVWDTQLQKDNAIKKYNYILDTYYKPTKAKLEAQATAATNASNAAAAAQASNSAAVNYTANTGTDSESLPDGVYSPFGQERKTIVDKNLWTTYIDFARYIYNLENNLIQDYTGKKKVRLAGGFAQYENVTPITNVVLIADRNAGEWSFSLDSNISQMEQISTGFPSALSFANRIVIGNGNGLASMSKADRMMAASKILAIAFASELVLRPYTSTDNSVAVGNNFSNDNQFNNTLIDSLQEQARIVEERRKQIEAQQAQDKLIEEQRKAEFARQQEDFRIQQQILDRQRLEDAEKLRQGMISMQQQAEAERLRREAEQKMFEDQRNAELANRLAREQAEREAAERERLLQAGNQQVINADKTGVKLGNQIYEKPADWTKKPDKPSTPSTENGVAPPADEESFFSKYKWWLIGGAVATLAIGTGVAVYKSKKPKLTDKNSKNKK